MGIVDRHYERATVGATGIGKEIRGFPVYYPDQPITFAVSKQDISQGQAFVWRAKRGQVSDEGTCDSCAISLAAKRQLGSPLATIGAAHAYIVLPYAHGIEVPGFEGRWAAFAYETSADAKEIIHANDTEDLLAPGTLVTLRPLRGSSRSTQKAQRNAQNPKRRNRGLKKKQPGKKRILEQGVRNYSGRVWPSKGVNVSDV